MHQNTALRNTERFLNLHGIRVQGHASPCVVPVLARVQLGELCESIFKEISALGELAPGWRPHEMMDLPAGESCLIRFVTGWH